VNPVEEMLRSARRDVRVARLALTEQLTGPASFHVQQAWEKYLKARLIQQGVRPRKVHKLAQLLDAGSDLHTINELLGHCNLDATMIYLHLQQSKRACLVSPFDAVINSKC